MPPTRLNRVDFPAPLGPIMDRISPLARLMVMQSLATRPSKCLVSFSAVNSILASTSPSFPVFLPEFLKPLPQRHAYAYQAPGEEDYCHNQCQPKGKARLGSQSHGISTNAKEARMRQ